MDGTSDLRPFEVSSGRCTTKQKKYNEHLKGKKAFVQLWPNRYLNQSIIKKLNSHCAVATQAQIGRKIPLFGCQNKSPGAFQWTGSSLVFTVSRLISARSRWWCFSLLWSAIWGDGNGHTCTSLISTAPLSLSASGAFNRCYNVSASECVCVCRCWLHTDGWCFAAWLSVSHITHVCRSTCLQLGLSAQRWSRGRPTGDCGRYIWRFSFCRGPDQREFLHDRRWIFSLHTLIQWTSSSSWSLSFSVSGKSDMKSFFARGNSTEIACMWCWGHRQRARKW